MSLVIKEMPECGYRKMKVPSYRPWSEKSVIYTNGHIIKHFKKSLPLFFKLNIKPLLLVALAVGLVWFFSLVNWIGFNESIFFTGIIFALGFGVIVRFIKTEIKYESLQLWFKEAYGLFVPYQEVILVLNNFYSGADKYTLSNNGVVSKTDKGLIYNTVSE